MNKPKLLYILAASHSGSTLLTMLLNSHPQVATVGALSPGHMEDSSWYHCSCGKPIRQCPFWRHVAAQARCRGLDFSIDNFGTRFTMPDSPLAGRLLGPLHRGPILEFVRKTALRTLTAWPARFAEIKRANEILVDIIMDYFKADVFVDKGNRALRLKHMLATDSFDVKVVHLIRDGRGVALTYMDPASFADAGDPDMREGGCGGDRRKERLPMDRAAYNWRRCNEEAEHALAAMNASDWIRVHYEDLCKDTENTLARIFELAGLAADRRVDRFRSVENHILGNGMRLDTTSAVTLDERWRSVLRTDDLRTFASTAGLMNRKYQYV